MFKLKRKMNFILLKLQNIFRKKVQPRSKSKMNATYNLINDRLQ